MSLKENYNTTGTINTFHVARSQQTFQKVDVVNQQNFLKKKVFCLQQCVATTLSKQQTTTQRRRNKKKKEENKWQQEMKK